MNETTPTTDENMTVEILAEDDVPYISEPPAPKVDKKPTKSDPIAVAFYGESFVRWQKLDEVRDLIPAFKEYYYQQKILDPKITLTKIARGFNEQIADEGRVFHPYTQNLRAWRTKWDKDILEKKGMTVQTLSTKRKVQQVVKSRKMEGADGKVEFEPTPYEELEAGVQTMAGELMNDAMQMLQDDQENPEIYDTTELLKRKSHVLNVFSHVTKMVHGKASLMLKASAEKRENANFLMDLMKKAASGEMTSAEIVSLRENYKPTTTNSEPQHVA